MGEKIVRQQYVKKLIMYVDSEKLRKNIPITKDSRIEVIRCIKQKEIELYLDSVPDRGSGTIIISDNSDVCNKCKERSIPVILFLHDEIRNHFFQIPYAIENMNVLNMEYLERVYRRYQGIPWDILETKRCILREITVKDVEAVARIYESPAVGRFMEPLYSPIEKEKEYTRNYIKHVYEFYEYGTWIIIEKKQGNIIGRAGLESYDENENGALELGYLIAEEYQRQGYGYEVCSAVLKFAEETLGITLIDANIEKENIASLCLCKKLGFHFLKKIKKNGKEYDKYRFRRIPYNVQV